MALPFEFALEGPPVSQQARRRNRVERWVQDVRAAADQYWDGSPPVDGAVAVSMVYIFDTVPFDVDNIPKPILDAMKGLVYSDDSQVSDLVCRKRDCEQTLHTAGVSHVFDECYCSYSQFRYIRVDEGNSQIVPL